MEAVECSSRNLELNPLFVKLPITVLLYNGS